MSRAARCLLLVAVPALLAVDGHDRPRPRLTTDALGPADHGAVPASAAAALPAPATAGVRPVRRRLAVDPASLVSLPEMLADLEALTAVGADSGWRMPASPGEAAALDLLASRLVTLAHLGTQDLTVERQQFPTPVGYHLRESRLWLTAGGNDVEVPANGLQGYREDASRALRFDSDGSLGDDRPDPVEVAGAVVVVRTPAEIAALTASTAAGRIVLCDYAAVDRSVLGNTAAQYNATTLLSKRPAGLVLLTSFSNRIGVSHGTFAADVGAITNVTGAPAAPTLVARLEDLGPAGVSSFSDLSRITGARLTWDADVVSPGVSGNLIATVPGTDRSRAVILGAHADSPNAPGALDDGSGAVNLLQVARVLDRAHLTPPVDIVLVWFGSEELGLYGSTFFAATHQNLLDRALAMLQVDCLTRPLDGIHASLNVVSWPYSRVGDDRVPWASYLAGRAAARGITVVPLPWIGIESDNSPFAGFDVPSANLISMDSEAMNAVGGVHYAGHLHDPYDTVDLVRQVAPVLEAMARTAVAAAIDTGSDGPALRVSPPADRRAVIVASHTWDAHMTPAGLIDFGMALAWEGFDVDLVEPGHPLAATDLAGADLVLALPPVDPGDDGADLAYGDDEVEALASYAESGGVLVVAASGMRLGFFNAVREANEDREGASALAARLGVSLAAGSLGGTYAQVVANHPLLAGVTRLELAPGNGVPFSAAGGQVLARAGSAAALGVVPVGSGTAVVIADLGILGTSGSADNLTFWRNLADFARSR